MITNQKFTCTPGLWYVNSPILMGVYVLGVWRNGLAQTKIDSTLTPGSGEFYFISTGALQFDPTNPFFGTLADDVRENVFVLFDV
jgi:hypothetical protein